MAKKQKNNKKKVKKTQGRFLWIPGAKKRAEQKAESERQKEMSKVPSFDTPLIKYKFTPSYIQLGERYGTLVDIVNLNGMNNDEEFAWFVNVLPNIDIEGVKGYLVSSDMIIQEKDERQLQEKDLNDLLQAVRSNGDTRFSSQKEKATKIANIQDIEDVKSMLDEKERIVDSDLHLLITADDPDKISQQMTRLQRYYDRRINGLQLTSVGGKQEQGFKDLFEPPKSSRFNFTWTTRTFAGTDHMIRKGIADRTGWGIGRIADSYTNGVAMMDLDKSFDRENQKLKGQMLIAASPSATVRGYKSRDFSAPSAWAQLTANQAMTVVPEPRQTFHIILNGFDYYQSLQKGERKYVVPAKYFLPDVEYHDASYGGLNLVEGFGEVSQAATIYAQKTATLTRIFYLLSGRELSKGAMATLEKALQQFYVENGLWDKDAGKKGQGYMARFLNLEDHRGVETLGDFTKKITNFLSKVSDGTSTEKEKDEVQDVFKTLEVALNAHPEIYMEHTVLPNRANRDKLQHYYDLSRLRSEQEHLESQFLNVFPYVLASAKANDIVVIHGMDRLTVETWEFIENKYMEYARSRDIRFIYVFDKVGSEAIKGETIAKSKYPRMDVFNARGTLYDDIEADFDVTILGMMNNEELDKYEELVSKKGKLPNNVRNALNSTATHNSAKFQVRRPADMSSNTVSAQFGI